MKKSVLIFSCLMLFITSGLHARHLDRSSKLNFSYVIYFSGDNSNVTQQTLVKLFSTSLRGFTFVEKFKRRQKNNHFAITVMDKDNSRYFIPSTQYLRHASLGLSVKHLQKLKQKPRLAYVSFFYNSGKGYSQLNRINKALHAIIQQYDAVIWDYSTRQMISSKAWQSLRLGGWQNGIPYVAGQINTHAYKKGKGFRIISMGQKKFGYPDIAIERFMWADRQYAGLLVNLLSQALVERAIEIQLGKFVMTMDKLTNKVFLKNIVGRMKVPLPKKITIAFRVVQRDKGDPDNRVLALDFRWKPGVNEKDRQHRYFVSLFKQDQRMDMVKNNNKEILAASKRAIKKLPSVRRRFNKGLAPGFVRVKASFKTMNGGVEYMWVQIVKWRGSSISGTLISSPVNIPAMKAGDKVKLRQSKVFDYVLRNPNGKIEGNESGKLIRKFRRR
ncbi:hypothetical protein MNBD_GAMMA12-725 [hydrothermal vent metagenome]|uniref:DUF2314 domain-containing protein n=1 Tax=hydrothermal vent metagenome TaxID=652676 RepID=A0A3B0ZM14_9ZZZZ